VETAPPRRDRRQSPPPPPAPRDAPDAPDTHDPAALFRAAVGDIQPLTASARREIDAPRPPPVPRQHWRDEKAALAESLCRGLSFEDRLDSGEEDAFLRPGLNRRILTDLRRGRWTPQDKIDLHGLNRDEARTALTLFLTAALAQGKRCIRVIHGKGLGSPGGIPILKQLSRAWLAQREEILAFCQANPHEGGAGALLVLLRAPSSRPGHRP
jgi:DNA-nicking Smr family endonuclease